MAPPTALALHLVLGVLCPDCPPAREARELVLSESFWLNAALMVLPFALVLAVAVALLHQLDRGSR